MRRAVEVLARAAQEGYFTPFPAPVKDFNQTQLMREILEAGLACICVKDEQGRFVYANQADASFYGVKAEELIGKTVEPWVGPQLFEEWYVDDLRVMREGTPVQYEPHARPDATGRVLWIQTIKIPLRNEQGKCDRLLVIHRDVTQLKAIETERQKLQDQLHHAQKMEAVGTLAGGVAHEFNNLLTPMRFQLDAVEQACGGDPKIAQLLEPARQAIQQAIDICQRVLVLSRTPTDKREPVLLNKVVQDVCGLIGRTYDQRVQLDLQLDPSLPPIDSSPSQISQVVMNLCNNARDTLLEKLQKAPTGWTPKITVRTSRSKSKPRYEPDVPETLCQCLEVSDNGLGMTGSVREHLFQPFFTTKPGGCGNGLGLYVTWSVVQSLQGRIEVDSEPGQGTGFSVYLPERVGAFSGAEPASSAPEVGTVCGHGHAEKVLFVDDNQLVSEAITSFLREHGHEVKVVGNGRDALVIAKEDPRAFPVLITDLNLPGLSGIELVKQLRLSRFPGRIVIYSGYLGAEDRKELEQLQVDQILIKPSSSDALLRAIRK